VIFEFKINDTASVRVYRGRMPTASVVVDGVEYPPETRLELDWKGRLTDSSRALLSRVLANDLKLDPQQAVDIEMAFYRKEFEGLFSSCVPLSHINDIEDPALCGRLVEVEALIASNSIATLVPTKISAIKEGVVQESRSFYAGAASLPLEFEGIPSERWLRLYRRYFPHLKDVEFRPEDFRSLYRISVRAPIFSLMKTEEGKLLDEEGREYKSHDLYLLSEKAADFQPSTLISVRGPVLSHPRTGRPVILADKWEFPEKIEAYDVELLRRLKVKLGSFPSVREKVEWILTEFEKYSGIVNRRNVALCDLLTYFTPLWLRFNGDTQRGWGNATVVGDTTTGKSETFRKMQRLLKGGTYLTAETASQVGLTGAAVQTEGRQDWVVSWGFLVLEDRRLLCVDGSQKLSAANWAALAEAERLGFVSIAKAAKAQAPARTRQIKIANPVDLELGKYSTKEMRSFLHAAQALSTVFDKTSIARMDLAVFARAEDVQPEEVNTQRSGTADPDLELLREALKWAWSGVEVKFSEDAIPELLDRSTGLYERFHAEDVPLVSIDQKWKLARLSAALAALTLSTDDFSILNVTKEHVDYVVDFMEREYIEAGLHTMAAEDRHEVLTEDEATLLIKTIAFDVFAEYDGTTKQKVLASQKEAERKVLDIIQFVVTQGRVTQEQVKTKFNLIRDKELKPLFARLETEGLIKRRNGFYPTSRSVQLIRLLTAQKSVDFGGFGGSD